MGVLYGIDYHFTANMSVVHQVVGAGHVTACRQSTCVNRRAVTSPGSPAQALTRHSFDDLRVNTRPTCFTAFRPPKPFARSPSLSISATEAAAEAVTEDDDVEYVQEKPRRTRRVRQKDANGEYVDQRIRVKLKSF